MSKDFTLPDLGEGIAEAQIIRVLVKEGDEIEEDQYLMEVETDKAAVEIPSPYAGTIEKVHVSEGQTVNVGHVVVTFSGEAGAAKASTSSAPAKKQTGVLQEASKPGGSPSPDARSAIGGTVLAEAEAPVSLRGRTTVPAAPAVRRLAREMGVDIDTLIGSGPGGRVLRDDVERGASGGAAVVPTPPRPVSQPATPPPGEPGTDKWGAVRREPMSQIRKTIATQMSRSAFTAVHVTHGDEADVTELDQIRRQLTEATGGNPKLTVMSFVIRATCLALKRFPVFNSSFDEPAGHIVYKDYVNMGIAVDSPRGLIVPVIRNADRLGLVGIASALVALADQIRNSRFAVEDLRGGTFTITNVGAIRGNVSTPIINFPEVAILGLGRSRWVPVIRKEEVTKAFVLPINLSFDHRVTDGANAARFAEEIISYLETPSKFLLD